MKHLHPQIRQKKKKWTLDQLKELIPITITKSLNRICKQLKTLLVLKTTKKIANYKEQSMNNEYEKEVEHLKQMKAINHSDLAKDFAWKLFPDEFLGEVKNGEELNLPDATIIDLFQKQSKFSLNLKELKEKLQTLFEERELLQQKQRNIEMNNMKHQVKKDSHKTNVKQAAVKAVFLDSLGGEDDDDEDEGEGSEEDGEGSQISDERKKSLEERRIQKSLRNQLNRKKNKEEREKELEMYMPVDQRGGLYKQQQDRDNGKNQRNFQTDRKQTFQKGRAPLRDRNDHNKRPRDDDRNRSFNNHSSSSSSSTFAPPANHNNFESQHKRQKVERSNNNNNPIVQDESKLKSLVTAGKEWKSTGVHPSWAAKQLQKTQIAITTAAPQGKKIVFDED